MGMFDTFFSADGKVVVQTKVGPNLMYTYTVGDRVPSDFPDAVIAGNEGYVVISEGRVLSVTEEYPEAVVRRVEETRGLPCITKWGGPFDPKRDRIEDFNPIVDAMNAIKALRGS